MTEPTLEHVLLKLNEGVAGKRQREVDLRGLAATRRRTTCSTSPPAGRHPLELVASSFEKALLSRNVSGELGVRSA